MKLADYLASIETHTVYEVYDSQDELLYIGVTSNLAQRMRQHRADSTHWFPQADRLEVSSYPTRLDAHAAEVAAIKARKPTYNVVNGDGLRKPKPPIEAAPLKYAPVDELE